MSIKEIIDDVFSKNTLIEDIESSTNPTIDDQINELKQQLTEALSEMYE